MTIIRRLVLSSAFNVEISCYIILIDVLYELAHFSVKIRYKGYNL
jgi:hypothetical protein